jgi:DNA-binding NtrC family response regulator
VDGGDEAAGQGPSRAARTAPGGLPGDLPADGLDLPTVRDAWEARMMRQALGRTEGKQAPAARSLHLTRDMFRSRMAKFGIEVDASVASDEDEGAED